VFAAWPSEIEALQDAKARALADYRRVRAGADPREDRSLEVLSRVEIALSG
jgi:hypothetical protein